MNEPNWVNQKQLAELLGLSQVEMGWKLVQYGLKDEQSGMATEEALEDNWAQTIKKWFGPDQYKWDSNKITPTFQSDPETQAMIETYVKQGLEICTQAYLLAESGYKKEALNLEGAFWETLPKAIHPQVRKTVRTMFMKAVPRLTKQILTEARVESEASAEILEFTPFRGEGVDKLIKELEECCYSQSLLTLSMGGKTGVTIMMRRENGVVKIGERYQDRERLEESLHFGVMLLLHSLTEERESETGQMIREVRGYQIGSGARGFFYKKIPPPILKLSYETAPNGKLDPAAPGVRYE